MMNAPPFIPDRIPTLKQFRSGLAAIGDALSAQQRRLLVEQYRFPMHKCFASDLAIQAGVAHRATVNAEYARAAAKFCEATDFLPSVRTDGRPQWWTVWSCGQSYAQGWYAWTMHADCVIALEQLGWVDATAFVDASSKLPEEVPTSAVFVDGGVRRIIVNAYERDPRARAACIAAQGLRCAVCRFRFDEQYGSIGDGFIHVHHVRPLGEARDTHTIDFTVDLVPVCPNCHAMLHRRTPAYSVDELRAMLHSSED